ADVQRLLGQVDGTHVLVTTHRDLGWQRYGLVPLRLGVLDTPAATDLLTGLTGDPDQAAGGALAADLGYLPLALDQAGAYVSQHPPTLAGSRQGRAAAPGRALPMPREGTAAARAVARVWSLTRTAIDGRNRLAGRLLDILAWLGPDLLPRDVLDPAADDPAQVADALALLASYSMITLTGGTVSVHRLVQTLTRHHPPAVPAATGTRSGRWWQRSRSPHDDPTHPAETAAQLLRNAAPTGDPLSVVSGWPRWQALLPHIDALAAVIPRQAETTTWSLLLDRSAI